MKGRRQKIILGMLVIVWVLVGMWAWSTFRSDPRVVAVTPSGDAEIALFLQEGGIADVNLEWLDGETQVGPPTRDLFSKEPIASVGGSGQGAPGTTSETGAAEPGAAQTTPEQPVVAAALRYMGFVETSRGTLALLRDGSQMYLAREGHRVGPGYLVAIVDQAFVEIEFKGARRRLPVSRQEGDINGR